MIPHPKASMIGCVQNSLPVVAAPKPAARDLSSYPPEQIEAAKDRLARSQPFAVYEYLRPVHEVVLAVNWAESAKKERHRPAVPGDTQESDAIKRGALRKAVARALASGETSFKGIHAATGGAKASVESTLARLVEGGLVSRHFNNHATRVFRLLVPEEIAATNLKIKPVSIDGETFPTMASLASRLGVTRKAVSYHFLRGDLEAWAAPLLTAEKSPPQGL